MSTPLDVWVAARVVLIELPTNDRNYVVGPIPDPQALADALDAKEVEGPLINGLYAVTIQDSDESDEELVARVTRVFQTLPDRFAASA